MQKKSELCTSNPCKRGSKCWFAHGYHELTCRTVEKRYKTQACYFQEKCAYGHRCHYLHQSDYASFCQRENHYILFTAGANGKSHIMLVRCLAEQSGIYRLAYRNLEHFYKSYPACYNAAMVNAATTKPVT